MLINLLVELYHYSDGLAYYYIKDDEIKEFEEDIAEYLLSISPFILTDDYLEYKDEKKHVIFKLTDYLKNVVYTTDKIFVIADGELINKYEAQRWR